MSIHKLLPHTKFRTLATYTFRNAYTACIKGGQHFSVHTENVIRELVHPKWEFESKCILVKHFELDELHVPLSGHKIIKHRLARQNYVSNATKSTDVKSQLEERHTYKFLPYLGLNRSSVSEMKVYLFTFIEELSAHFPDVSNVSFLWSYQLHTWW